MAYRIAVVEDDEAVRRMLVEALTENGYEVKGYATGTAGLEGLRAAPPALVLLDVGLPGLSGIEVCRALRADPATSRVLVVMLTGLNAEADEILGFEVGADDYVTKPFAIGALVARIQGVLRRNATPSADATLVHGPLVIHTKRREALLLGKLLPLTPTEFRLLHMLVSNRDRTLTRQEMIETEAGGKEGRDRKVDVHVTSLREKLGSHGGRMIETVYGEGYRIGKAG